MNLSVIRSQAHGCQLSLKGEPYLLPPLLRGGARARRGRRGQFFNNYLSVSHTLASSPDKESREVCNRALFLPPTDGGGGFCEAKDGGVDMRKEHFFREHIKCSY